ncbi:helix-turn-helix transcriptional regulator [Jongsikchunia kroppenstedtii]|uniref:helix-turn-helix transcriptional regulator n=1 Tax=Jongsikchunia kroppenstedtii TaxID=1121721 RepID=UPI0005BB96AC|nr:helix-turn-helix transcriptional regulator [Jongsikchunia kroppenstedtii]
MVSVTPLGQIVGDNVRRMRTGAGHTGDALSKALREFGPWPTSRVSELELGRVSPTVATLFTVAHGLSNLLGRTVLVADLLRHDGYTEIGRIQLPASAVVDAFAGKPADLPADDAIDADRDRRLLADYTGPPLSADTIRAVLRESGEPESRLARGLGVSEADLAGYSAQLWGHTFSAQRDKLAGTDANAQKRGQVSRKLKAEIKAEIDRATTGADPTPHRTSDT